MGGRNAEERKGGSWLVVFVDASDSAVACDCARGGVRLSERRVFPDVSCLVLLVTGALACSDARGGDEEGKRVG